MKNIFGLILIFLTLKISYSQNSNNDPVIILIQNALKNNPIQFVDNNQELFSKLDSSKQEIVLNYLYTYSQDSLLYMNINKVHQLLEIFYVSKFIRIRQKATNLLLETYRLGQGTKSIGWVYYKNAKISDFDEVARKRILSIIKEEPFSKTELELLYKYELRLLKNSYSNDTLRIRMYRKKTALTLNGLRDSVAMDVAKDNMKNKKPSEYLEDFNIYNLAAWLYMFEAIPYIEKSMEFAKSEYKRYYKLSLARLGNKLYEKELLDDMNKSNNYDFRILGYLRTPKSLDFIIKSLRLKGKPKGMTSARNKEGKWVQVEIEGDPFNCTYLRELILSKLILDMPFKFDILSLAMCEISEFEIQKVIEWLENNKDTSILNPDYH